MPLRVVPGTKRDQNNINNDNSPARSDTALSESERSFVSAASGNKSSEGSHISQSEEAASSPSISEASVQPTPLAGSTITSSPSSKAATLPFIESYFTPQPGVSGFEARSPTNKRAPASRSSHGIETKSGPPPALSTQRSHHADPPWRSPPSADPTITAPFSLAVNGTISPSKRSSKSIAHNSPLDGINPSAARRGSLVCVTQQHDALESMDDDQSATIRSEGRPIQNSQGRNVRDKSHDESSLNLRRADSVADDSSDTMSRVERLRPRQGYPASRVAGPSSSGRPSSSGGRHFGQQTLRGFGSHTPENSSFDSPTTMKSLANFRDESSRDRPYAASAHPLDQMRRARYSGSNAKGTPSSPQQRDGDLPMTHGRRRSFHLSSHDKYNSSPLHECLGSSRGDNDVPRDRGDGTESTVSTTAPSTVWDELDDLKSRIRKIELTGNLPPNSHAAMSNVYGDRPGTATTTMTTVSSSPKRRQGVNASPVASTTEEPHTAHLHPLLQSALSKARFAINPDLYKALEATSSDALALAAMTGGKGSQGGAAFPNSNLIDRKMRRKADNMCRSITELCIALTENVLQSEDADRVHPGNSATANSIAQRSQDPRISRAVSEDPDFRASSRVMNRFEARRTSLLATSSFGVPSRRNSPQSSPLPTPTQERPPIPNKLDRTSSVIRRRDEDSESNISRRPLSRGAPETGSHRPSPQTRTSREYTSQHPMPTISHRLPSVQSSVPQRKTYFPSSFVQSPNTPNVQSGNRRYLDRSTPPSTESARLAEARQRRIASLGQSSPANGGSISGVSNGRLRQVEMEG